ncbi:signal transducer and activator of transcription A-like [Gossypium australe]|uniref:Signal transducer and activator of transcription A-like n=1 Tax=Gossypium australe TaxID=47621 RepID=A0A5B6VPK0_9ROSI|nr:signal transducer and activator of transcription A-like [Gossypium australe]
MDDIDELQDNFLEVEDRPEPDRENEPTIETGKETPKDVEITKVPFPSRLEERTLNVNIPLIELIDKVPKYAKFLKNMMVRRKKIKVGEQVPRKLKDPRNFIIPIEIRSVHFNRALCNLGASINLMSLSVFEKIRLGNLKTTQITLQLGDRSSVHPKGVLDDMLVKVQSFIIPTNFGVLDFKEDHEISILLGRPFMATSRSTIDLEKND